MNVSIIIKGDIKNKRTDNNESVVDKDKCTGIGQCTDICPVKAIKLEDEIAVVSEE